MIFISRCHLNQRHAYSFSFPIYTGPLTIATDLDPRSKTQDPRPKILTQKDRGFWNEKGLTYNLPCAHDSCTVAKAGALSFLFPPPEGMF